ncbi:MAG TPA: Rpn family recombination-promoting nuclease/putative transposase, partial [Allocoleopsis sp.]
SIEIDNLDQFDIIDPNKITRIYLEELEEQSSLGIGVIKLVVTSEKKAVDQAKNLIQQTKVEITSPVNQKDLINLIQTIIVYKLPKKTREEIENMLGLSELKQTKVYQEALAEGEQIGQEKGEQKSKQEAIKRMLKLGVSPELIAEYLDLPVKFIKEQAKNSSN